MSLEVFKPIEGYEQYFITSWGNVYHAPTGKRLIPEQTSKGYLRVHLYNENGRKHFKVHRLVANAFIPNPFNLPQVNHIDGNKENNSITNLEWVTDRENKDAAKALRRTECTE